MTFEFLHVPLPSLELAPMAADVGRFRPIQTLLALSARTDSVRAERASAAHVAELNASLADRRSARLG
jgi:hypothetical protein